MSHELVALAKAVVDMAHDIGQKDKTIRVWRFADAPQTLQLLSNHGGDEDWVAWVPPEYAQDSIPWLESGSEFGPCRTSEHDLPDGSTVYTGAHA